MPINYKEYPPNWKTEIRPRILARAGEVRDESGTVIKEACCEFCGIVNRLEGWRFPSGRFITVEDFASGYMSPEDERAAEKVLRRKAYKICLTIAHLDHDKRNHGVRDERLAALCQGCHLGHDRHIHKAKAAITRMKKKGQASLF